MPVKKVVHTSYIGQDEHAGFEFNFEPIENSLTIEKNPDPRSTTKFVARYLVQDTDARSPDEDGDDGLFLVGYHRDFTVDRGSRALVTIYPEAEFKKDNGYNGRVYADNYGWKSLEEAKAQGLLNKQVRRGKYTPGISQELAQCIARGGKYEDDSINDEAKDYIKKYHIFPLEAYIHSGVRLYLSGGCGVDRAWDVSQLGMVFVSKKEWRMRKSAEKAARGLIETWNDYLDGSVYGIVREDYDADKKRIGGDECWGYYGYEYALKELKGI